MICPICHKPESDKEKFYFHYGNVLCCYSCKVFFRRYVIDSKKKRPCKFQNRCNLHYSVRKGKCAYCRFQKCLSLGMKTRYVVINEGIAPIGMCILQTCNSAFINHHSFSEIQPQNVISTTTQTENVPFIYNFTCLNVLLDLSFVEKLFDYHKGEARFLLKEHLFGYVLILCKQFEHFAMSLADFVSLPKMDQTKLLHQNTPMYVQLILAMYFNGKTGFEQLSALPGIEPQMNEVYPRVTLDRMNQQLGLFHPSSLQQYQNLLESDDFQVSK